MKSIARITLIILIAALLLSACVDNGMRGKIEFNAQLTAIAQETPQQ